MTKTKISLKNLMKSYKKLPWMWILKVCTQIKPKVSVPWHLNSINKGNMLIPEDVSNNFIKTKNCFRSVTFYSNTNCYIYVKSPQKDKLL